MTTKKWAMAATAAMVLGACTTTPGADDAPIMTPFGEVTIEPTDLGDGIYMLTGGGGNIGLSVGEDGAFMIDDQFDVLSDRIAYVVKELGGGEVRFIVNTHHHFDHAQGNANFGDRGATIVAHENVRRRLMEPSLGPSSDGSLAPGAEPAQRPSGWPVITFAQSVTFHMNGQTVHVVHTPPGHTDGDSMIYFQEADVLHSGDAWIPVGYPFVDLASGGSLEGLIEAQSMALERITDDTRIIPGHGPVSTKADMVATRDGLANFREILAPLAASDMSVEEIVAVGPLADYDAEWGQGFISTDDFVAAVVASLRAGD